MTLKAKTTRNKAKTPRCSDAGRNLRGCRYGKGSKSECSVAGQQLRMCHASGVVPLHAVATPAKTPRRRTSTSSNARVSFSPTPRTPEARHPTHFVHSPARRAVRRRRTIYISSDLIRNINHPDPHDSPFIYDSLPRLKTVQENIAEAQAEREAQRLKLANARKSSRDRKPARRLVTEI
jgi:hypothetical protein